jgi:hypothetical protein
VERHRRAVIREFVEHYHAERNHQGLSNVIPFPSADSTSPVGRIGRLGGVLSFYKRNARESVAIENWDTTGAEQRDERRAVRYDESPPRRERLPRP